MRVLHIINGEHYSGAERVQDLIALGLANAGVECSFATLKKGRFSQFRASSSELHDFSMRTRLDFRQALLLADHAKKGNFCAIHSHTPRSAMLAGVVRMFTRLPHFHHGHSPTRDDSSRTAMNIVNAAVERRAIAGCSHLFAVSQRMVEYFTSMGIDRSRVSLVENGVPYRPEVLSLRPPTPGVPVRVGMSALFRPRKGLETALRALASLKRNGQHATFMGIGPFETEEYRSQIMRLVCALGVEQEVKWTGFTTEVFAELAELDVFWFPSLYGEGLPMALIEAMSIGLPCIGSDIEGVRGPLGGGNGVLVSVGDAESLADATRALWTDLSSREMVSQSARITQRTRYSVDSMSQAILREYRRSLNAH